MGRRYTNEIQSKYITAMGEELGNFFCALSPELIWIRTRWAQFRILFGDKPSRIELLNRAAPLFFGILQDTLFADTVLGIARIVDKAESGRRSKSNLTIEQFPRLIDDDSAFKTQVKQLITKAKDLTEFATDWRNRRLAHLDLDLKLDKKEAKPLAPASRKSVEESLQAIAAVLNCVEDKYCGSQTMYNFALAAPGDALCLLSTLRDGLLEEDSQTRRARGEWNWDDGIERRRREPI